MDITIHKGGNEIGGNCVEITCSGTTLLIDIGQPLSDESKPVDIEKLHPDAVFISHPHQDHYGLIGNLDDTVPIYLGKLSKCLMDSSRVFWGKRPLCKNFQFIEPWNSVEVGKFAVTPYLVDHSAVDAYAYLVEADGVKAFYSGDFRAHGRKAILFDNLLKNPPGNVDILLMEGTNLGGDAEECHDEKSVEDKMLEVLKSELGLCFLICSSQNLDRIVSAYRAAKRAGRIFVVDIYTAWVLRQINTFFKSVPDINWDDIRVLSRGRTAKNHYLTVKNNPSFFGDFAQDLYKDKNEITQDAIKKNPRQYFVKNNCVHELVNKLDYSKTSVIYSMWPGYLTAENNPDGYKRLERLRKNSSINFIQIHTSGHAFSEDLKRFAAALAPAMLVPIHTERKELYLNNFDNVRIIDDGVKVQVRSDH